MQTLQEELNQPFLPEFLHPAVDQMLQALFKITQARVFNQQGKGIQIKRLKRWGFFPDFFLFVIFLSFSLSPTSRKATLDFLLFPDKYQVLQLLPVQIKLDE